VHRVFCPIRSGDGVFEELTPREHQVLYLVAAGARNQEVARHLQVSIKTVEFHLSNIRGKLGARSRTEAVMRACQVGILDVEAVMRSREMSLYDLNSHTWDRGAPVPALVRPRGLA
jgi:DNA-binding CsgD family transcriptional regulator